jgi:hypothetical protein
MGIMAEKIEAPQSSPMSAARIDNAVLPAEGVLAELQGDLGRLDSTPASERWTGRTWSRFWCGRRAT